MNPSSLTPHGPGFSFIDRIEALDQEKLFRAYKFLDPDLPFFKDHFPGRPIMPGVLLIECAAQAAGCLWSHRQQAPPGTPYLLAQVLMFKVLQAVLPGETIEIEVGLEKELSGLAQFMATVRSGSETVAQGRLVLAAGAATAE